MSRISGSVAALVFGCITAAWAQGTAVPQGRDGARIVFSGGATVTGIVVMDTADRPPLRRATVTLSRQGVEDIRTTSSDDRGQFTFASLPAGTYLLSAAKGGFLTLSYGAPKPGMPGRSIVVGDRDGFAAEPMALMRGGVIAGRVVDRHGRPLANLNVQAAQFVVVAGEWRRRQTAGASGTSTTNDHGEYRIFGLMPGEYLVFVASPAFVGQTDVTPAEVAWARKPDGTPPPVSRPTMAAATLYPGVVSAAEAVAVKLEAGDERLGIDLPVQSVPVARVSGKVVGVDGAPVPGVILERTHIGGQTLSGVSVVVVTPATTGADGTFALPSIPPGQWAIGARAVAPGTQPAAERQLWGSTSVPVAGADVDGVQIRLQPAMTITGSVAVKGATAGSPAPTAVRLQVIPAAGGAPLARFGSSVPDASGQFRIPGLTPGRYRMSVTVPGLTPASPWWVRSAMLGDRDLIDTAIEIRPGEDVSGVVVAIDDARTELSGAITDAAGRPISSLYVLVFSSDRSQWEFASRRVVAVRASETGAYVIAGLPPGEYYLCALTEVDTTRQTSDPSYFDELTPASIKLTIAEGEKKRQDLRVGR